MKRNNWNYLRKTNRNECIPDRGKSLKHKNGICNDPPGLRCNIPRNTSSAVDEEQKAEARLSFVTANDQIPLDVHQELQSMKSNPVELVVYTTPLSLIWAVSRYRHNMAADQFDKQHCPTCVSKCFVYFQCNMRWGMWPYANPFVKRANFSGCKRLTL